MRTKISMKKKTAATLTAGAIVVGGAAGAYAYWTTSGSGTGSAATSAGVSNLAVTQTSTISNMFPGDSAQAISGTVKNNATQSAYVTAVTASITSVDKAAGAALGTCDASDYVLANPVMTVGVDVAAGATQSFSGASIKFNNKTGATAANQDACKGATVNLAYAAS
jgi:hypothetical protein